jgi:hypothetical protein
VRVRQPSPASDIVHLLPDETEDDGIMDVAWANGPIPPNDLFNFDANGWIGLHKGYATKRLAEEVELCDLSNQGAEGAEVDADEMMGDILTS